MRNQDPDNYVNVTDAQVTDYRITRTNKLQIKNTQAIGTTEEALQMGDVTTEGWAVFHNLDANNFVEVGFTVTATFYAAIKLLAGEQCIVALSDTPTWQAKADTATVNLRYAIYERNA